MKRSLLVIAVMFSFMMGHAQVLSTETGKAMPSVPGMYPATNTDSGNRDVSNVLVIRDYIAWGCNINVPTLTGLGANVTVIPVNQVATHDFAPYCLIVIEGSIDPPQASALSAQVAKFEAYVNAGGTMEIHACTQGYVSMDLPGGVTSIFNGSSVNNVVNAGHPIASGIPASFTGSWASHNYLSNLYPGTVVIIANEYGQPTTIEYAYGNGLITATGCTYEYGYCTGETAGAVLLNNLAYSLDNCNLPVNEVPIAPWAFAIALLLILGTAIVRYKRIF